MCKTETNSQMGNKLVVTKGRGKGQLGKWSSQIQTTVCETDKQRGYAV